MCFDLLSRIEEMKGKDSVGVLEVSYNEAKIGKFMRYIK